jgi:SAM-dependent methyltransferase
MSIAINQVDRLAERQWRTWVGSDCASVAAGIELIAERLVESAGLRAGDLVLDVATATGDAALAAARCGCVVTAVDDVEALLERGRKRAVVEGLGVMFTQNDPERPLYPDASFDAVLSCLGVMFTARHRSAARELLRVCRPGGTIALASWTPVGFLGRVCQTVAAHLPTPSLMWPPGLWGTREHLEQLLGDAIDELTLTRREFVLRFRSHAEFVDALRDSCGPARNAFDALDNGGREALYEDLVALVAVHDREAGAVGRCAVGVPRGYRRRAANRLEHLTRCDTRGHS